VFIASSVVHLLNLCKAQLSRLNHVATSICLSLCQPLILAFIALGENVDENNCDHLDGHDHLTKWHDNFQGHPTQWTHCLVQQIDHLDRESKLTNKSSNSMDIDDGSNKFHQHLD